MQMGKLKLQPRLHHDFHRDNRLVLEGHAVARTDILHLLAVESLCHPLLHEVSFATQTISVLDLARQSFTHAPVQTKVSQRSDSFLLGEFIFLNLSFQDQLLGLETANPQQIEGQELQVSTPNFPDCIVQPSSLCREDPLLASGRMPSDQSLLNQTSIVDLG